MGGSLQPVSRLECSSHVREAVAVIATEHFARHLTSSAQGRLQQHRDVYTPRAAMFTKRQCIFGIGKLVSVYYRLLEDQNLSGIMEIRLFVVLLASRLATGAGPPHHVGRLVAASQAAEESSCLKWDEAQTECLCERACNDAKRTEWEQVCSGTSDLKCTGCERFTQTCHYCHNNKNAEGCFDCKGEPGLMSDCDEFVRVRTR